MEKQMKTQTSSTRSSFARFFFAAMLAGSFSFAQAQETPKKNVDAEIKYAGVSDNKIYFQVAYKNETGEPFTIEIKDEQGYPFYVAHYKDKNFKKFFAIDKSEIEKVAISFAVVTKSAEQKKCSTSTPQRKFRKKLA